MMVTDDSKEYISLNEATKYCSYSQEYLSLRVRQGKLKALKFGRNWVTKKEWLEEYLDKIQKLKAELPFMETRAKRPRLFFPLATLGRWKMKVNPKGETSSATSFCEAKVSIDDGKLRRRETSSATERSEGKYADEVLIAFKNKNLAIENLIINNPSPAAAEKPALRFNFMAVLVFVSLAAGIFFGKDSLKSGYGELYPYGVKVYEGLDAFNGEVERIAADIGQKFAIGSEEAFNYFTGEMRGLGKGVAEGFFPWAGKKLILASGKFIERMGTAARQGFSFIDGEAIRINEGLDGILTASIANFFDLVR